MEDIDWDDLPPTTTPQALPVAVLGFDNRDAAEALGRAVGEIAMTLGSFMDLSTLDGITIGYDYDAALASLDQGMEGLPPLDRTDTMELQGVAKTCQVVRQGQVRSHIVFGAAMLVPLIAGDAVTEADRQTAVGLVAHECGHVQVNACSEALVPDARLGARIADFERSVLFPIANVLWDEYAVCRLVARFAPQQNGQHAETLDAVLPGARERADAAIRAYRLDGDLRRLLGEAATELVTPLKAAAYLLGGMDAGGLDWDGFVDTRAALVASGYADAIDRMRAACARLWDTRAAWSVEEDVLAPLVELVRDVLAEGGILFRRVGAEWRIDVPFTANPMP